MSEISTSIIREAVYKLCFEANTCLDEGVYSKILKEYQETSSSVLKYILKNAQIAYATKKPLCQDTGQVIVFLEIGQNVKLIGNYIEDEINLAVKQCYEDNFFRKSVVENAVFDRKNTKTNTPAIIYTKITEGDSINIKILIKGAGSENKSKTEMMLPTAGEEEIIECCSNLISQSGVNACPPMFIGIGIGSTLDRAVVMSKEALVNNEFSLKEKALADKIKENVNKNAPKEYNGSYVLDIKLLTSPTHIACMPVAVTINCHSDRTSSCSIDERGITYHNKIPNFVDFPQSIYNFEEVLADDYEKIKTLKKGQEVLLTGNIYVARDMAHKKIHEMIIKGEQLPFKLENAIIFYAGPCPEKNGEIIGSIGPTTSSRMDKYAVELYNKGLLATIGKGNRSEQVVSVINANKAKYFTVIGGIAAYLAEKVKNKQVIAFEELGAEALLKIYVEKLPVKAEI